MTTNVTIDIKSAPSRRNDAVSNITPETALTCADYVPRIEGLLKSARAEVARARKLLELLSDPPPPATKL
jgi:hypothetical protein